VKFCYVPVYVGQILRPFLKDDSTCYIEGCLVIYSVSEFDFVRRVAAYVCLCVINICDPVTGIKSVTDPH
jgi:hypothetical protein